MLFRGHTLDAIAAGRVRLAFRRWLRPTVRAGGRLRTAVGELAIEAVEPLDSADALTEAEARAAGFDVGYRLSPRGAAVLDALEARRGG